MIILVGVIMVVMMVQLPVALYILLPALRLRMAIFARHMHRWIQRVFWHQPLSSGLATS